MAERPSGKKLTANELVLQKLKETFSPSRVFDGTYPLTGLLRCPQCGTTLGAHRVRDTLKDGTVVNRRYYVCNNFRNRGSRVCGSNSVRADMVESFVFERLSEAVQKPKVLEDVVKKINIDRTKNVARLALFRLTRKTLF
jgi:site-specific DNA recombinase